MYIICFFCCVGIHVREGGKQHKLSRDNPRNNSLGVELIAISNECAVIKVLRTNEILTLRKGGRINERMFIYYISDDKHEIILVRLYPILRFYWYSR